MTNGTFRLLTEDEKQTKFRSVLNAKTKGCLMGGEVRGSLVGQRSIYQPVDSG